MGNVQSITLKKDMAKILIIDDQKLHALSLEKILVNAGYQNTRCLTEPLKALNMVQEYLPDLLVLDLIMPQLDGFQIIEQLHGFRRQHYLPILALSEGKNPNARLRALQAGATDYLSQPFEDVEIIFRIKNMVETRSLHAQVENQNRALEDKVRDRTKELREAQFDVMRRLALAAEFRDNKTGSHIMRLGYYCAKFAESLGLTDAECEFLLHASPLHDVGKIGIPDRILLKPGPLTSEEFDVMKTHTTIGAELLAGSHSPVMQMAETIALTHQEKWDGSGYPQGLRKEEIPMIGQICSVCDVFDALTTERPYKKAWTPQAALEQMSREKETHFQPKLVDRFIEIFPEVERIRTQNPD